MSQQQKQFPFFYKDGRVELKDINIIEAKDRTYYFIQDEIQSKRLTFRQEVYCYPNGDGSYRYLVMYIEQ